MTVVVIVTGGRAYADRDAVWRELDALAPRVLVHGACPTGADAHADAWAATRPGVVVCRWPAEWERDGRKAGPMRNQRMIYNTREVLGDEHPIVLVFPGGRGTADCMRRALKAGLDVRMVRPAYARIREQRQASASPDWSALAAAMSP